MHTVKMDYINPMQRLGREHCWPVHELIVLKISCSLLVCCLPVCTPEINCARQRTFVRSAHKYNSDITRSVLCTLYCETVEKETFG